MKKNVIVTGATGNLGKAVVDQFLKQGYHIVAAVTAGKPSGLEGMPDVEIFEADLTNEISTSSAIARICATYETIDAAVLLVGGYAPGGVTETDGALLQKMYSLNFETAWFVARPLFLQMKNQKRGRIVLIGSRPSLKPKDGKGSIAYALAKSLLFKMAEFFNEEGTVNNVVTSVIVPSTIDTPVNRKAMPDADFTKWVKAEDIAAVISLAADSNSILREPILKVYGQA